MILIISQKSDFATTQVISWLRFFKKEYLRINGDENYNILEITDNKVLIDKNGSIYNLMKYESYWYRRSGFSTLHLGGKPHVLSQKISIPRCLTSPLQAEFEVIRNHIYKMIEANADPNKRIGSFFTRSVNKLNVIKQAKAVGLTVPFTALVSTKEALSHIVSQKKVITKAVAESIYSGEKKRFYTSYTSRVTLDDLKYIPDTFMTSLVQEEVEKKYELRVFYLKGKIYTSVIFSQSSEDGMVDCRRALDFRYLPYKLPKIIEKKVSSLMKKLQLNTGSIDMIVDSNNEYIFLEVNPVGQFVAYGEFCNYYLDRELAKIL